MTWRWLFTVNRADQLACCSSHRLRVIDFLRIISLELFFSLLLTLNYGTMNKKEENTRVQSGNLHVEEKRKFLVESLQIDVYVEERKHADA